MIYHRRLGRKKKKAKKTFLTNITVIRPNIGSTDCESEEERLNLNLTPKKRTNGAIKVVACSSIVGIRVPTNRVISNNAFQIGKF